MFFPLKDDNPLVIIPFQIVTAVLIAANVLIFITFQSGLVFQAAQASTMAFGMIPDLIFDNAAADPQFSAVPDLFTLITYMFVHAGWMHLISNMAFLWVFGDNIEDAMGHIRFLCFYLICGIAAALCHAVMTPDQAAPLVGASGAGAGVIAAYLLLHPRVKVWVLLFMRIPLKIPAMIVLGGWLLIQIISLTGAESDNVAWWAHMGGFVTGLALTPLLKRDEIPLFDKGASH